MISGSPRIDGDPLDQIWRRKHDAERGQMVTFEADARNGEWFCRIHVETKSEDSRFYHGAGLTYVEAVLSLVDNLVPAYMDKIGPLTDLPMEIRGDVIQQAQEWLDQIQPKIDVVVESQSAEHYGNVVVIHAVGDWIVHLGRNHESSSSRRWWRSGGYVVTHRPTGRVIGAFNEPEGAMALTAYLDRFISKFDQTNGPPTDHAYFHAHIDKVLEDSWIVPQWKPPTKEKTS